MVIAEHYMKSFRFFADLGSILGTGFITSYLGEQFKFFGIFKISRVRRLSILIGSLNIPDT